jgi:hypothetical protein
MQRSTITPAEADTWDVTYWLTSAETANRIRRYVSTVRRAAEAGELHGHQRCFGGRWVFHRDAVDACARGLDDRAQREACGCPAAR